MTDSIPHPDSQKDLAELLMHRARHASDGRLVLDVAGGALAALGVGIWRPAAWLALLSAALCFASFGAWGIADRVLGEREVASGTVVRLLRLGRAGAALVGALAALGLLLTLFGLALGTWIS